jgi:Asp-tRNA(Asn)/Glu-tRNA(Gln) amidotransferase A subunit family amidase
MRERDPLHAVALHGRPMRRHGRRRRVRCEVRLWWGVPSVSEYADISAVELERLYADGAIDPVAVWRSVRERMDAWEPVVHATSHRDDATSESEARAAAQRWRTGRPRGPLDGVPVTVKENIATAGVPTPLGTAAAELVPARADAPVVARLREAGAVIVAKTTMPDYGMLSSGLSSFHPLTRNPWDLTQNPGGSSAGAGAAAAAGYGPLHVGTDIGGSIRLPAGWCGVFGLKPSLGRIPIKPPFAGRVAGPMTRTVEDAALLMAELSKPDWRDAMSLPYQTIEWTRLHRDVKGLRLGLQMDSGWGMAVETDVRDAVEAAARAFERAGAIVEPMPAFSTRAMIDGMDRFWRMRSWLDISALPSERRDKVLPYIRQWVASGSSLSATEVFHGYSQMAALRDAAVAACQPFDFVLSPVSPVPSYAAEWASPLNDPQRPFEHIAFTLPYNMSEQPAASINCGYTSTGLPIGLQIIGHRHDDLGVLQVSWAYEQLRPAQRPWPLS